MFWCTVGEVAVTEGDVEEVAVTEEILRNRDPETTEERTPDC